MPNTTPSYEVEILLDDSPRSETKNPNYHFPAVAWDEEWKGKRWRDMPGACDDTRKMNFALFRRGLYSAEESVEAARSFGRHFNKGKKKAGPGRPRQNAA